MKTQAWYIVIAGNRISAFLCDNWEQRNILAERAKDARNMVLIFNGETPQALGKMQYFWVSPEGEINKVSKPDSPILYFHNIQDPDFPDG